MLKNIFTTVFIGAFVCASYAQPPINTTRRLTDADRNAMLEPPTCMTGGSEPRNLNAQLETWFMRFDRRFIVETESVAGVRSYFCMLINTVDGYAAYLRPKFELSPSVAEMNVNAEDFMLTVISMRGNVLIFSNMSTGATIKKQLYFGNTNMMPVGALANMERRQMTRLSGTRNFVNNSIVSFPYKIPVDDGESPPTFYLLKGRGFTNSGSIQAQQFLGTLGVGYVKANDGIYLSLGFERGGSKVKIIGMDNQSVMFDGGNFECLDCDFVTKGLLSISEQREKLHNQRIGSNTCLTESENIKRLKLDQLDQKEELLRHYGLSNAYNTDSIRYTRNVTILDLQDPLFGLRLDLLKLRQTLCGTLDNQRRLGGNYGAKISCINHRINVTDIAIGDMQAINSRYRDDISKGVLEKSQIQLRLARELNECRY